MLLFAFRGIITAEEKDQNSEGRMPPVLHLRHCWHDKHAVGFFISQERRVLNLKITCAASAVGLANESISVETDSPTARQATRRG